MVDLVDKTAGRVGRRLESSGDLLKGEVNVAKDSAKILISGVQMGLNDLGQIRPVKALADVAKGIVKAVTNIPVGTIENVAKFAEEQGNITKEIVR